MIFNMADGILTHCNVARSWHWFRQGLHSAMRDVALGWHAIEFAWWQHPAMSHVALESWHWIRQVAAPCSVAGGSGVTCHVIRRNVSHIGILHLVAISTTYITAVDMSFCTSLLNFIQIGPPLAENMASCRFSRWWISAILDFRDPIIGSLKSPITELPIQVVNTHHSSKLLSFWENCQFCILASRSKMADLRHFGFYGCNNGFFEKPLYDFL